MDWEQIVAFRNAITGQMWDPNDVEILFETDPWPSMSVPIFDELCAKYKQELYDAYDRLYVTHGRKALWLRS